MKVKELIEELKKQSPDSLVFMEDEVGYRDYQLKTVADVDGQLGIKVVG